MKLADQTTRKAGFTLVETMVVLVILLIIAGFVARVVYHDELRKIDEWFVETFGFSHLWVMIPAIVLYVAYRLRARRNRRSRGDQFTLPQD